MLKLLFRLLCLTILGVLAFDIIQTGSFEKSNSYKYMKESGALHYGEDVVKKAKKSFDKASEWAEKNIPVYYNEACVHVKPYINLSYNLGMTLKSNTVSLIHHIAIYLDKNFPQFQENASVMLTDSVTLAKKSLVVISGHLQNYTHLAVEYVNNMLGS